MNIDIVLGIVVTAVALGAVVLLTLWSRLRIERIYTRSLRSMREIQESFRNDRKN